MAFTDKDNLDVPIPVYVSGVVTLNSGFVGSVGITDDGGTSFAAIGVPNADGATVGDSLYTQSFLYGYDEATSTWNRVRTNLSGQGALFVASSGLQGIMIADSDGDTVGVDGSVNALKTIGVAHDKIHDGEAFSASYIDSDSDITSGTVIRLSVVDDKEYHVVFSTQTNGAGQVFVHEVADVSGYGVTAITPVCNNRVSKTSSTLLVYVGGHYVSGDGIQLYGQRIGVGGPQKLGGDARVGYEWILASGNYVFSFYPDADDKLTSIIAEYYEVEV